MSSNESSDVVKKMLTQAVARFLAPDSLAVEREGLSVDEQCASPRVCAVQPGDLILVNTPGRVYEYMRQLTKHKYDHVAAVVCDNQVVHIGPSTVRLMPVNRLLVNARHPLVLRPHLDDAERTAFVSHLEALVGRDYDMLRLYSLIARLTLERHLNIKLPLGRIASRAKQTAFICSQVILNALQDVSVSLKQAIISTNLDCDTVGAASIMDFVTLHVEHPQLFAGVELPPAAPSTADESSAVARQRGLEDLHILNTGIAFTRACLLHLTPQILKIRAKQALQSFESLPPAAVFLLNLSLLVCVYKRYPVPVLFSLLPQAKL